MENILVILGSFLSLPCTWKAESFVAGFQLGVAWGRCEQEPRGWVGEAKVWSSLPSSSGSTPGNADSPPPNCVSLQSSSVAPALEVGPCETPFPPPLSSGLGQSQLPPMLDSQTFPHQFWFLRPFPPLQVLRDPSITVSSRVHLRRTLNGSET